mgnify:CR=1 FL=1
MALLFCRTTKKYSSLFYMFRICALLFGLHATWWTSAQMAGFQHALRKMAYALRK